ncbi:hypothetical protein MEC_00898 [Bartonella alsatica IBS 382]|uniref:Uncharacterized protein n=1 Tax=Bartonella alsatica IBS 382 TaxID=1094551 RepID=J1IV19_9HYPH|nr:hypothetical protein MEC_00898 [Bartonella alsatica IBS 382]
MFLLFFTRMTGKNLYQNVIIVNHFYGVDLWSRMIIFTKNLMKLLRKQKILIYIKTLFCIRQINETCSGQILFSRKTLDEASPDTGILQF